MDPAASAREPWTDVPAKEAEQPQYYQNDDNSPQHEKSPLNDPLAATRPFDLAAISIPDSRDYWLA
jgi:hypothetical protein